MEHLAPGWIVTFTGRRVWPLALRIVDIDPKDICHALSMRTRWGGFCNTFYCHAQHAVLVSNWVAAHGGTWQDQWDALHQDDVLAYGFPDAHSPLRDAMPDLLAAEARGRAVIADVFGCSQTPSRLVSEAHARIQADEAEDLMAVPTGGWGHHPAGLMPLGIIIQPWPPEYAQAEWLGRFTDLMDILSERGRG